MPHNAKTIPDHKEKQNSPGSIMQHNAHPLSIMPEYYFVRVPLASPNMEGRMPPDAVHLPDGLLRGRGLAEQDL